MEPRNPSSRRPELEFFRDANKDDQWKQGFEDNDALRQLHSPQTTETKDGVQVDYPCASCLRECQALIDPSEIYAIAHDVRPRPGLGSDVAWELNPGPAGGYAPRIVCACRFDHPSFVLTPEECRQTLMRFPRYRSHPSVRAIKLRVRALSLAARVANRLEPLLSAVKAYAQSVGKPPAPVETTDRWPWPPA